MGARARRHARAREQGEPRRGRRARARREGAGRRPAAARRLRALGALPMPRGPRSGVDRLARPDRVRRPVSRTEPRRARGRDRRGGARASHVEHGAEDHRRLGDPRQQGTRADRGALPLRRPLRPDRARPPSDLRRPLTRALPRRRGARAPRLSGHDGADLVCAHVSGAGRDGRASTGPGRGSDPGVCGTRPGDVPAGRAGAARRRGRRHVPGRVQRRQRGRRRRLPGRPLALPRIAEVVEETLGAVDGTPARDLDELVEADGNARRLAGRGVPVA
jgi:hypothetical protein